MTPNWSLVIGFPAANVTDAEDKAAAVLDQIKFASRSALYYPDSISGEMKLWAEPAEDTEGLAVHRDRS